MEAEEDAHVAMAACGLQGLHTGGQREIADDLVLEQRDAVRAAMRRLVVALAVQVQDAVAVLLLVDGPFFRVGGQPGFGAVVEAVLVDKLEMMIGEGVDAQRAEQSEQ